VIGKNLVGAVPDTRVGGRAVGIGALALVLFLVLGILAVLRFASIERERDLGHWQVRLGIVADGRAAAVGDWLERQLGELSGLADNTSLQIYMTELALARGDRSQVTDEPAQISFLRNLLIVTAQRGGFGVPAPGPQVNANARRAGLGGLALLDAERKPLVATPDMPAFDQRLLGFVEATKPGERATLDIHLGQDGAPTMAFLVPIFGVQGGRTAADQVGWALGVKPVGGELYPLLRPPGPAEPGAETLLVRLAGNAIEYLSPLPDGTPPLRRRMALDTPNLAEAYAVQNPGGFAVRRDSQGKEVLVTGRTVANASWTVVQEVERDVALGESDSRAARLSALLFLSLGAIAAVLVAVWRHASSRRATKAAADLAALARRFEQQGDLLRLVTDTQPNAIFILDGEGRYRFANEETARRAGLAQEELEGKRIEAVLGPAAAAYLLRNNAEALETGQPVHSVERIDENGRTVVLQSAHIPMPELPGAVRPVLVVEQDVTQLTQERERRERTLRRLVGTLTAACDRRDKFAGEQSARSAALARAIAEEMGLAPVLAETAEIAGNLMNFGKILVPPELLTKTDQLTPEEMRQIRDSVQGTADLIQEVEFDGPVVDTLRQVAERWDGTGPRGLKGEGILITARIVAVANAFVALASARAWRQGKDVDTVLATILDQVGTAFDRKVVAALVSWFDTRGARARWGDPAWITPGQGARPASAA
jgi:PAS domain S-box-containing protein